MPPLINGLQFLRDGVHNILAVAIHPLFAYGQVDTAQTTVGDNEYRFAGTLAGGINATLLIGNLIAVVIRDDLENRAAAAGSRRSRLI